MLLARVIRPIPAGAVTIPISQEPIDVSGWLNVDVLVKARYIELATVPVIQSSFINVSAPEQAVKDTSFDDPFNSTEVDSHQEDDEPALGSLAKPRGRPKAGVR